MILGLMVLLFVPYACVAGDPQPVVFATFVASGAELHNALILTESIRTFGGQAKNAPVWIYGSAGFLKTQKDLVRKLVALKAQVKPSDVPAEASNVPFALAVFAAATAERDASGAAKMLVWMGNDTVVLKDPGEFLLAEGKSLGYRPVTHQNIGSLFSEAPDAFWRHLYEKLAVSEAAMFPMKTVADGKTLRPYFTAGLVVVRPERGIMKRWAESFSALCADPAFVEMCAKDSRTNTFLHQAALTGAILNLLKKDEMVELSDRYNYPVFFKEMYGGDKEFDTIDGVATMSYDIYFQNPGPNWATKLKGPAETVSWLKERFGVGKGGGAASSSTKMRYRFQHGEKKH
jgi:hypothetical protein